tara:strand:+ start:1727 stop:3382 length:1656 start_codon:yes stop_codon:yes gene_type:complete
MQINNIFTHLVQEFSKEHIGSVIFIILLSVSLGLIQTNGISEFTALLIDNIEGKTNTIWRIFYLLAFFFVLYHICYYLFNSTQIGLVYEMKPWARFKLMDLIMQTNNINFSEDNFTKLNSPIHRVADLIAQIIFDVIGYMVPNIIYILIIGIYFWYLDPSLMTIFLGGNSLILLIFYFSFDYLLNKNMEYEELTQRTDGIIIDLLNNMDKIIYRGRVNEESEKFKDLQDENTNHGKDYYLATNRISSIMSSILMIVFLISLTYLIKLVINKKISKVSFIASFTILNIFKDKLWSVFEQIPEFAGYIGRMNISFKYFKEVSEQLDLILEKKKYSDPKLKLDTIKFENIVYKYTNGKTVFDNKNINIDLNNRIIGITGPSGSGKSTLMKLLLRMYHYEGNIYIDDVNIKDIDPLFIRNQFTYVNQSSKLFDKKVIDNMLYGCMDENQCNNYLEKIMKYPQISKLYQNIDIYNKDSGQLGENLSGGQRQIINMIGGLINSSPILILDEPTNALDPSLKNEVIGIIKDFKHIKENIIIITHDKDVFTIFDDEIKL